MGKASYSETFNDECDNFDVNYKENEYLTDREQIQAMDDALLESLDRFEECIKAKTSARQNNVDDSIENASDRSQELRGNKLSADQESTESYNEQNQNTENELAGSINKNNSGSNGKIPEDIPFDDNDDVLAQQIKNAALKESDPEKQKKIWNEYRKYKNLPLED
ncbi:hypothetical protein OA848_00335 [Rickettsiales bacterium]|nr:hypothetical protein [Rickettsiales bacterium]